LCKLLEARSSIQTTGTHSTLRYRSRSRLRTTCSRSTGSNLRRPAAEEKGSWQGAIDCSTTKKRPAAVAADEEEEEEEEEELGTTKSDSTSQVLLEEGLELELALVLAARR